MTREDWKSKGRLVKDLFQMYRENEPDVYEDYSMEGVEEGYAIFRTTMRPVDNLIVVGYIIAAKDGKDTVTIQPIVIKNDATQEVIDEEYRESEKKLLSYYAQL